ncbi:hypothetical protein Glove_606g199 [Diversispora epigaea]|uniref:NUMOD4 domain-containing protein n=1 Tax=Diversispora epigaea TaxID=1348612 RepID=A0A397GCT2_9GLOM|nr:hypothetical protein Glove_606g199 [Diversispora epigaea]
MGLDGNLFRFGIHLSLAQDTLNIHKSAISMCYSRKQNSAGGWCWMYYEYYIESDPNEEWKEIEFDSEKFKVSSLGGVQTVNGIIMQRDLHSGYLRIGRGHQNYRVHHLVALAFFLKEHGKNYVNHIDGDLINNKVSNFEWVTSKENTQHAVIRKFFERNILITESAVPAFSQKWRTRVSHVSYKIQITPRCYQNHFANLTMKYSKIFFNLTISIVFFLATHIAEAYHIQVFSTLISSLDCWGWVLDRDLPQYHQKFFYPPHKFYVEMIFSEFNWSIIGR